jgi:hypothetical protein
MPLVTVFRSSTGGRREDGVRPAGCLVHLTRSYFQQTIRLFGTSSSGLTPGEVATEMYEDWESDSDYQSSDSDLSDSESITTDPGGMGEDDPSGRRSMGSLTTGLPLEHGHRLHFAGSDSEDSEEDTPRATPADLPVHNPPESDKSIILANEPDDGNSGYHPTRETRFCDALPESRLVQIGVLVNAHTHTNPTRRPTRGFFDTKEDFFFPVPGGGQIAEQQDGTKECLTNDSDARWKDVDSSDTIHRLFITGSGDLSGQHEEGEGPEVDGDFEDLETRTDDNHSPNAALLAKRESLRRTIR